MATSTKPVARLDASLLLARKGEAAPAIAATQHNNPALAWGAAEALLHDFQPHQSVRGQEDGGQEGGARSAAPASRGTQPVAARSKPVAARTKPVAARTKPVATAHLRTESFFIGRRAQIKKAPQSKDNEVSLNLHLEDETYLRLKYLSQKSGLSTQKILTDALGMHLVRKGVPQTRKITLKT